MVIWCDRVGGLQWRPDPLSRNGPDVPGGSTQRGQEIGTSPKYCLLYRDVSTEHSIDKMAAACARNFMGKASVIDVSAK